MDEGKIAIRYSKALLSLAKEKQVSELVTVDMKTIFHLFETIPGFSQVLESPVIKTKAKRIFLEEVFSKTVNPITFNFLMLLLANNRETYLKDISRIFLDSYRHEAGFKEARLTSAVEIDTATVDQFRVFIRKHFNSEVDLTCVVDDKLIGGFVLQVEDQQLDASVATKLLKLKRELLASQR